jgi:hypothetical protein
LPLNPYTLLEETEEERRVRNRYTGEIGNGTTVYCRPFLDDPDVVHQKHRVVCLMKPYLQCPSCPHSKFTVLLNLRNPAVEREMVQCPKWTTELDRQKGKSPDSYVSTERATCALKPFDFCQGCPSVDSLVELGIDKKKEGWYSRWRRFTQEEEESTEEEEEDG